MTPAGVIRPIPWAAANHMLPSGPAAIPSGPVRKAGSVNCWMAPVAVVTRPMRLPDRSVNQRLPSWPAAILSGDEFADRPEVYSVTAFAVVIRPILPVFGGAVKLEPPSVNHR